jgi:hypothetical protein
MKKPLFVLCLVLVLAAPAAAMPLPWMARTHARPATIVFRPPGVQAQQLDTRQAVAPTAEEELLLTPESKIYLNGRPCRYEDVPVGATITTAEVADDGKTILAIYFEKK